LIKGNSRRKKRVVVAMSGGVDSSTAAALLKERGFEVIGVTMQIWPSEDLAAEADKFRGCCSLEAVEQARRVAARLEILHYVMNFRRVFEERVISDFCREYARGRTPNPCIRCNQFIKFDVLLMRARALDADFIATGHYARIEFNPSTKRFFLKKGIDPRKDQSYVLYGMTQENLQHTLMPLGGYTKEEVRQMAHKWKLPVADRPESQEICFILGDNYGRFVERHLEKNAQPGPIIDRKGRKLGEHRGILFYTVGQRRGLGISSPEPLYVVEIDRGKNALVVGGEKDIYADELLAEEVNYISKDHLEEFTQVQAKIRYNTEQAPARVSPLSNGRVRVRFKKPQRAITPGQAVVFYQGDIVLGGGTIVCAKT
jgi:tRNA-specific 2-thiouridylase